MYTDFVSEAWTVYLERRGEVAGSGGYAPIRAWCCAGGNSSHSAHGQRDIHCQSWTLAEVSHGQFLESACSNGISPFMRDLCNAPSSSSIHTSLHQVMMMAIVSIDGDSANTTVLTRWPTFLLRRICCWHHPPTQLEDVSHTQLKDFLQAQLNDALHPQLKIFDAHS